MTQNAIHAKGTIVQVGDAPVESTPVYAAIAELISAPWPQRENPRIDTTTHDSPGFAREYIPNLTDFPAIDFRIFFDPNEPTHDYIDGLGALNVSQDRVGFKIITQPAVTPALHVEFNGTVSRFNVNAPIDAPYSADVQLQPSGEATYTYV